MIEIAYYTLRLAVEWFFYMMLGRVALALITGGKQSVVAELFRKATFPAYWVVRRLTPSAVDDRHIPILSIPLLLALLILLPPLRQVPA